MAFTAEVAALVIRAALIPIQSPVLASNELSAILLVHGIRTYCAIGLSLRGNV